MKRFAQIDGAGLCVALLDTSGEVAGADMVPIANGEERIGQKWTGAAWVAEAEDRAALRELGKIDAETGMSRTMRETLIAIGKKVAADVAFLEAKENDAKAKRLKLK